MNAHRLIPACLLSGGLAYAGFAHSETINRCVDAAGKVSYSSTSCPSGAAKVKALETPTPPSPDTGAHLPEYKQQELELQQRREARLAREREEEAESARMKAHEERLRQQKDQEEYDARQRAREAANTTRSQQLREMGIDGY